MPERSNKDKSFGLYINEGEMYQIEEWVLKHKNIETGGDLFGLWLDDHTAVVQFVLGPGKKCRRTTTSFFQDVQYLQEAGSYLTDKHGLCNIGQWHSHHRIRLSKPSHGDENTVWENMPVLGLNKYIVFIANITNEVTVNCFLFHYQDRKRLLTKGQFKFLHGNSPLRLNGMVLQNTFEGLESFINPAAFEGEMKFLRNRDSNEEDRDRAQNVEHEKSATPETTEVENLNAKLPKEQPHETATFKSQRLQDNDVMDKNCDTMITDNTETYTQTQDLFGNTSVYNEHDNKNSLAANISFGHEQNDRNISRPNNDERNKLDIFNANYTRNDASNSVMHKRPAIRHNNAKDHINILNKGNVRTEMEIIVRPNTHNFTAHEKHNPDILKHDVVETCTHNIPLGREQNNGNISNEDDETYTRELPTKNSLERNDGKDNDILKDDNVGTFIENTGQYDTRVSVGDRQHGKKSLRGDNDAKDNPDILNKVNIGTFIENREQSNADNPVTHKKDNTEQYDTNISDKHTENNKNVSQELSPVNTRKPENHKNDSPRKVIVTEDGQHGRKSLRSENDAKDNNILNKDNIETYSYAGNTEQCDTSISVGDRQHGRKSLRGHNDVKDNRDILNKDNIRTFTGNTEQCVDHGQHNRKSSRPNIDAKDNLDILDRNNTGTFTENREQSNADVSITHEKGNTEQYDTNISDKHNENNKNVSREPSPFNTARQLENHKNESLRKVTVTANFVERKKTSIFQSTRNEQNGAEQSQNTDWNEDSPPGRQTASETRNHNLKNYNREAKSNAYEPKLKEKAETDMSATLFIAKGPETSQPPKPIRYPNRNENAKTQPTPQPSTNAETANLTSNSGLQNYNAYEQSQLKKTPRKGDQAPERKANSTNWQTEQKQSEYKRISTPTTGCWQKNENFLTTSQNTQHYATKPQRAGMRKNERGPYNDGVLQRSTSAPTFRNTQTGNTVVKYMGSTPSKVGNEKSISKQHLRNNTRGYPDMGRYRNELKPKSVRQSQNPKYNQPSSKTQTTRPNHPSGMIQDEESSLRRQNKNGDRTEMYRRTTSRQISNV